ncbi:hypothetical protein RFI_12073 [Reticulomyxa filosa]|uniref:Uncharacterized protein n=1 Tax=Reticulomyxa filosa TaxID=46433 RepID=X6NI91_RETFI|nr:hypothetical protein RFI_12073 [Reticulomyxa filosa]|eukprot:ETO25072.1 hypothetical protein RFI_12073 [Reticulomyxa filosa]
MSKILGRDPELLSKEGPPRDSPNANATDQPSSPVVELNDEEFQDLKSQCLQSLNSVEGRMAFAILLNRQRNADHGLELGKIQFLELANLVELFCDSVEKHNPIDVKPAKLVMIMTQSLYVRKDSVADDPKFQEKILLQTPANNTTSTTTITSTDTLLRSSESQINEASSPPNVQDDNVENEKKEETSPNTGDKVEIQAVSSSSRSLLPKQDKIFLVDLIKHHHLWKSETFWKEAFCDSLKQELKKYPIMQRWHSTQEQMEADRRNREITFSQLAAITHNMKEFGMQDSTIINFLDSQDLNSDKKMMLKATLGIIDPAPLPQPTSIAKQTKSTPEIALTKEVDTHTQHLESEGNDSNEWDTDITVTATPTDNEKDQQFIHLPNNHPNSMEMLPTPNGGIFDVKSGSLEST